MMVYGSAGRFEAKYNFSPDWKDLENFNRSENCRCRRTRLSYEGKLLEKAKMYQRARDIRQREIDRLEGIAREEQRLEVCRRQEREDKEKILASVAVAETPTNLIMTVETNNNNQPSRGFFRRDRCLTDVPAREILATLIASAILTQLLLSLWAMWHLQ